MTNLKKFCFMVFFVGILAGLQAKDLIINLPDKLLGFTSQYFYIEDVIDSRQNKENIGVATTGVFNRKTNCQLNGDFKDVIKNILTNTFPYADGKIPITINIYDLYVSEDARFGYELSKTYLKLNYLTTRNNKSIILYSDKIIIEKRSNIDCTKFHRENIMNAFEQSFQKFILLGISLEEVESKNSILEEKKEKESNYKKNNYSNYDWKKANQFNLKYNTIFKGVLLEYEKEIMLSSNFKSASSYSYNIGYYGIVNSNINIEFNNSYSDKGSLNFYSIPLSLSFNKIIKEGIFIGEWSYGLMGYYYIASIDTNKYGDFDGHGFGGAVRLGVSNIIFDSKGVLKINALLIIPVIFDRVYNYGSYIDFPGYGGFYLGLSYSKYF